MVRRFGITRLVQLLAAFALLASASTVSAECACVLWSLRDGGYTPMASFAGRDACISNIASLAKSANEKGDLLTVAAGIVSYKREDGSVALVQCFPDTIDPRGPKGR